MTSGGGSYDLLYGVCRRRRPLAFVCLFVPISGASPCMRQSHGRKRSISPFMPWDYIDGFSFYCQRIPWCYLMTHVQSFLSVTAHALTMIFVGWVTTLRTMSQSPVISLCLFVSHCLLRVKEYRQAVIGRRRSTNCCCCSMRLLHFATITDQATKSKSGSYNL